MRNRRILFILAAVFLLTGCQSGKYVKVELRETMSSGDTGGRGGADEPPPDVIISAGPDQDVSFVIEEETGTEAEGLSGEGEALSGQPEVTLLFGGDVLLSDHVLEAYREAGGIQGVVDEEYRRVISQADFFMVNQEFPFSDRGSKAEDKEYTFRLPPERVSMFQELGIDGVTLANNHALDYGQEALLDSCETLDRAGILHTGAGEDLAAAKRAITIEAGGRRIALLGATRVMPLYDWTAGSSRPGMFSAYDPAALLAEVKALDASSDVVIVYIHWGVEREEQPEDYQRELGRRLIDAGADLVIGAHPHVLQGIEYYKDKPILYSLGNFVFGSSIPRTVLLQAEWGTGAEQPVLRLIPGTSGAGYTHTLASQEKRDEFFRYMESISAGIRIEENGTVIRPEQEQD